MSLSDVTLYKDYPIVAGFVRVPPNDQSAQNAIPLARALELVPGATVVTLSPGSGPGSGGNFGAQRLFRVPARQLDCCNWWTQDPAALLNADVPPPTPPTFSAVQS